MGFSSGMQIFQSILYKVQKIFEKLNFLWFFKNYMREPNLFIVFLII